MNRAVQRGVGPARTAAAGLTRAGMTAVIKSVCDILRRSNCAGAMQYVPEASWLFFLRFLDERDEAAERSGAGERSPIRPPYRWRDWASLPRPSLFTADGDRAPGWKREQLCRKGPGCLLAFVRDELLPYLHGLDDPTDPRATVIRAVLRTVARPRVESEADLLAVLDRLDGLRETAIDNTHVFPLSEVFESLLLKMGEKAGDGGQFFTPREVIRVMVRVIDPKPGESVYDPCCGTGGFLAEAFESVRQIDAAAPCRNNFFGWEKDSLVYPITLANLLLHGIDHPRICNGNTLRGTAVEASVFGDAPDTFDVILTNPPFGGKEGKEVQNQFPYPTGSTQVLFLQHVLGRLRPGGRCGIVVDEGVLFRTGETGFVQTKRHLLAECDLWCVVSLPPNTFASAGAGVKTDLLFFTKGSPTTSIWYYDLSARSVGKRSPLGSEDFLEFFRLLPTRAVGPRSWNRSIQDVVEAGYDLKAVNPYAAAQRTTRSVPELVADLKELGRDLDRCFDALRDKG